MNLNHQAGDLSFVLEVSIPIRDLMNLNLTSVIGVPSLWTVSIPIRDLMNLNLLQSSLTLSHFSFNPY